MPKDYGNDIDYRTIAKRLSSGSKEPLTYIGVRAVFLRIMKKFAIEYITTYRPELTGNKKVKGRAFTLGNCGTIQTLWTHPFCPIRLSYQCNTK